MKIILFGFLLTCAVLAHGDVPKGLFQLDPNHSKMVLLEKNLKMMGLIEIHDDFSKSKFITSSDHARFESTKFIGGLNDFEVKGSLTYKGLSRRITMKGKYLGMIQNAVSKNRAAFSFTHQDLFMRVIADQPSHTTTALLKEVADIVEQSMTP